MDVWELEGSLLKQTFGHIKSECGENKKVAYEKQLHN